MYNSSMAPATANAIQARLATEGVDVPVAQIYAFDVFADQWHTGQITLPELCTRTLWNLPATATGEPGEVMRYYLSRAMTHLNTIRPDEGSTDRVKAIAHDLHSLRMTANQLYIDLRTALVAADRQGQGRGHRESLVRAAARGVSRAGVFRIFGIADILTDAEAALKDVVLPAKVHYSLQHAKDSALLYCDGEEQRAVLNCVPILIRRLGEAGLQVTSDGPHETTNADLADHYPAIITRAV